MILLSVGRGTPRTLAAQASGISVTAFYDWIKDEPDFKSRIIEAEARWADTLIEKAMEHVAGADQRVSANMIQWLLERRAFQFFARKEIVKTGRGTAEDGDGLEVTATTVESAEVSAAKLEQIVALLVGAGVGEDTGRPDPGADAEADEVHSARTNGHTNGVPAGSGS